MKYMLPIYDNREALEALPESELRELMNQAGAIMSELTESGELVGGEALADPSQTKTVRARGGVPAITDGPAAARRTTSLPEQRYVEGRAARLYPQPRSKS